jgi:hypothetical protein
LGGRGRWISEFEASLVYKVSSRTGRAIQRNPVSKNRKKGKKKKKKRSQDRNSSRAETWRQELMQRPWRDAVYWLAHNDLISLLSYRTQNHQPIDGNTHNGLGPPTSITN